ncbi:MAG: DUF488 domain-containing protein [Chloroflexi bacterium]|nr:DUF488 domain-containing protein [Chloroflexota bacterium]
MIKLKRAYKPAAPDDGPRFLVDRLWPRGLKKEELKLAAWLKEVAPSNELRKWFGHDPGRWEEFRRRYTAELDGRPESWQPLLDAARKGDTTLVYGASNAARNNAVVLKAYLERRVLHASS